MAAPIDPTQQERLNRIMGTQTANAVPSLVVEEPAPAVATPEPTTQTMVAKKTGSKTLLIVIAVIIFFAAYAAFWAFYFKLI